VGTRGRRRRRHRRGRDSDRRLRRRRLRRRSAPRRRGDLSRRVRGKRRHRRRRLRTLRRPVRGHGRSRRHPLRVAGREARVRMSRVPAEDNVAVANWRESVAGSELAGEVQVVDAMDQIAELRDEFEPEARKSRHLQRRIRSIVRKLDGGAGCWTSKRSSTRPRHPRSTGTTRPFRRSSRRRSPTNSSQSR